MSSRRNHDVYVLGREVDKDLDLYSGMQRKPRWAPLDRGMQAWGVVGLAFRHPDRCEAALPLPSPHTLSSPLLDRC